MAADTGNGSGADDQPVQISLFPRWPEDYESPTHFANTFLVHGNLAAHEFILSIGTIIPPLDREGQFDSAAIEIGEVPVRPVVRIGLTPSRMRELADILQEQSDKYAAYVRKEAEQNRAGFKDPE